MYQANIELIMDASIQFLDGEFSLIHIPLSLYPTFLQPILRVFMPHDIPDIENEESDIDSAISHISLTDKNKIPFLNISITPIECSVVCTTSLASQYFLPAISALPSGFAEKVSILKDPYMIFSVNSGSMESGQRVIQLTAPLAMAGISIFFITTYYTDFILVPAKDRGVVVAALMERGFRFDASVVAEQEGKDGKGGRGRSMSSGFATNVPVESVVELQRRTHAHLLANNVVPYIADPPLRVVCVKGETDTDTSNTMRGGYKKGSSTTAKEAAWLKNIDAPLYLSIISALALTPRFFSLTLTLDDSPSILMDRSLLSLFGNSVQGNMEERLVPIFLDLGSLEIECTGIVCGVGGMVVRAAKREGEDCSEMSYLSTARAGCLIVNEVGAEVALGAMISGGGNEEEVEESGTGSGKVETERKGWDIPAARGKGK